MPILIRSRIVIAALAAAALAFAACAKTASESSSPATAGNTAADPRLNGSFREDRGG